MGGEGVCGGWRWTEGGGGRVEGVRWRGGEVEGGWVEGGGWRVEGGREVERVEGEGWRICSSRTEPNGTAPHNPEANRGKPIPDRTKPQHLC